MSNELLVIVPMSLIERIRAEIRLNAGDWIELDACVAQAASDEALPCDVRVPPATTYPAGSSSHALRLALLQRSAGPVERKSFSTEPRA